MGRLQKFGICERKNELSGCAHELGVPASFKRSSGKPGEYDHVKINYSINQVNTVAEYLLSQGFEDESVSTSDPKLRKLLKPAPKSWRPVPKLLKDSEFDLVFKYFNRSDDFSLIEYTQKGLDFLDNRGYMSPGKTIEQMLNAWDSDVISGPINWEAEQDGITIGLA